MVETVILKKDCFSEIEGLTDQRIDGSGRIPSILVDQTHEKATTDKHASWLYQSHRKAHSI